MPIFRQRSPTGTPCAACCNTAVICSTENRRPRLLYVFDGEGERAGFADNVAAELVEHGLWLSLIGSTEGAPRAQGPPRRSAREVINAIEPSLEIMQLRST